MFLEAYDRKFVEIIMSDIGLCILFDSERRVALHSSRRL